MAVSPLLANVGLLLVFFLPGFGITRALFPERRVLRPASLRTLIEQLTSSVVLSVVATILVGFAWLNSAQGVEAGWSAPVVEVTLAGIAAIALAIAAVRGAFNRVAPRERARAIEPGHERPFELIRELEGLAREKRRLEHRLRLLERGSPEAEGIARDLERVKGEAERVRRRREAEYAV